MTHDSFHTTFPNICSILQGTVLDDDLSAAINFAKEGEQSLRDALEAEVFKLNELMWYVAGAIAPTFADPTGVALENDLSVIIAQVGFDVARRTYRDKLLVNDRNTLEDARYEIAVTSKACAVFDIGSVQLEKPIPDARKQQRHWKNTDVFGSINGQPIRIEVTVLHESLLGAVRLELDDMIKAAQTHSGFSIALRTVLADKGYAERVRAMVELLEEAHRDSGGKDREIDGVRFQWKRGAYHCEQDTCPFKSIVFHTEPELPDGASLREITYPGSARNTTPRFILEDHPNPLGVVSLADRPDAPTQVPVSTKIRQMLAGKLQQCEQGVVNIIAFGNPLPIHDREVANAVLGAEVVIVPFTEDENGVRHFGKAAVNRNQKAAFVPAHYLANDDDRREFVDPFRKMSAVWHTRIGTDAKSMVIQNPNALLPTPPQLVEAFSDPVAPAAVETTSSTASQDASPNEFQTEQTENLGKEIVSNETAENYVLAFDTLEEARAGLENVTATGLSLDALWEKVEQLWSEPSRVVKEKKFISPTNEEMVMSFVVDCGGYEQAKKCLETYAEAHGESSDDK